MGVAEPGDRMKSADCLLLSSRALAQVTKDKIFDMGYSHVLVVFGRELAIEKIGQGISVREVVISQGGYRYVEFDGIDRRSEIACLLTLF